MSKRTSECYVLLVAWANGAHQAIPIPPSKVVSLGPEMAPPSTAVALHAPNSRQTIGWVVVHGEERPKLTVAPAPAAGVSASAGLDGTEYVPEWLAELMAELGRRHGSSTVQGLEAAAAEAVRMAEDFALRSKSCASLASGYRSAASALVSIDEQDADGWARRSDTTRSFFRESVTLAREGEEVGA